MDHGEQLLQTAAEEALEKAPRELLFARLGADPKLRASVIWLLAHFATDHSPHFLAALANELERDGGERGDAVEGALARTVSLPALELRELLASDERPYPEGPA